MAHRILKIPNRRDLLLIMVSVGLTLAAGELLLRAANFHIGRLSDDTFEVFESDAKFGWRMRPEINLLTHTGDVENIPVRSNSLGFRDEEFALRASGALTRVIFLGDSFTYGYGVSEEDRFTNLLESEAPEFESLNYGISAYGIDQSYLVWTELASNFDPAYVILTVFTNDYEDNVSRVRWGRTKPFFVLKDDGGLRLGSFDINTNFYDTGIFHEIAPHYAAGYSQPVKKRSRVANWLVKRSDLVRLVHRSFYAISARWSEITRNEPPPSRAIQARTVNETQLELMKRLLLALRESVEQKGAQLIVMLSGDMIAEHQWLINFLEAEKISNIDATNEVLRQQVEPAAARVKFTINGHWTPAGHRVAAKLVMKQLRAMERRQSGRN